MSKLGHFEIVLKTPNGEEVELDTVIVYPEEIMEMLKREVDEDDGFDSVKEDYVDDQIRDGGAIETLTQEIIEWSKKK